MAEQQRRQGPTRRAAPPAVVRYAVAVALVALAFGARLAIDALVGRPYELWGPFYLATLAATAFAGAGGGVLALALGLTIGWYASVDPRFAFFPLSLAGAFSIGMFAIVGSGIVAVARRMLGSEARARALADSLAERVRTSERLQAAAERASAAEHATAEKLALTLESGQLAYWEVDLVAHRAEWSESRAGLLGLPASDTTPGFVAWQHAVHPSDLPGVLAERDRALRERSDFRSVHRIVRPDGTCRWLDARGRFVHDPAGTPVRMLGVCFDVTDEREAEAALQAANRRLRATMDHLAVVTDHMGAAVVRCTKDLRYLWASRHYAQWIGREVEDLIGRHVVDVIGTAAFETVRPYVERALRGERVEYEAEVPIRDIGTRWVNAVYVPTVGADGAPDGWVGAIFDVTARKRLEAELRQADRHRNEFLAMLAHELRGPLAPIRNAAAVLRALASSAPSVARAGTIIERQVTHMARLVDDLLEVSRITRGEIALQRMVVSLHELVEEAVEAVRPLMERHEHSVSVTQEPGPLHVHADPARIVQIVTNLLTNAAKFTPRGGHVTVETARGARGDAVVRVRDTGIGIANEALARIFELFTQEETTLARSQGGLGIGLTLVRRLAELHGGRVEVESDGPGRGSTFTVTLPAVAAARPVAATPEPRAPSDRRRRILVVEDNADTAETVALMLGLAGHEVRTAEHGLEALRLLDEFVPHVAFVDLGLPDLSGFDVARRLRADPRTRDALLVAVSGYGRDEDKTEARRSGFDHHLTKPVLPEDMLALVRTFEEDAAQRGDAILLD